MSRPSKLSPEDKKYIVEANRLGTHTIKALAEKFDVSTAPINKAIREAKEAQPGAVPIIKPKKVQMTALELLEQEVSQHKKELENLESIKDRISKLQQEIIKKENIISLLKGEQV